MAAALCAIIAVAGLAEVAQAQSFVPIHRYNFANPAGAATDGAVIADSAGTADGAVRGSGATFTGSRVGLPGGASATAPYVDLPNGLLSVNSTNNGGPGRITFEGWAKVTGAQSWARILDFGSTTGGELFAPGGGGEGRNYFFYSASIGGAVNRRRTDVTVRDTGIGGGVEFDTGTFNQDVHFVITWDEASGLVVTYENGVQVGTFTTPAAMSAVTDVNVWLGRSNWVNDNGMQGEFDEFRIYNQVFPAEQARANFVAGPDGFSTGAVQIAIQPTNVVQNETRPVSFSTLALGDLPITYQWYKNDAPIPGATSTTYSNAVVPVADNGARIYAVASNNVSGTPYTATSQVATLTVIGDTIAPTVLQARANSATTIELFFSELIRTADATTAGNYSLSGPPVTPTILSAAVGGDATRVVLGLSGPLTACQSYTVGISGVHDASVSGNVIAPGTTISFFNFVLAGLTHRYTFNLPIATDATGLAIPDTAGTAHGVVLNGSGITRSTGTRITLSGGDDIVAPYIDLPNGLLSANSANNGGSGQLTFEGWVRNTGANNWSRIFDFGSSDLGGGVGGEVTVPGGPNNNGGGLDYFMLSANVGTGTAQRRTELRNEDPAGGGITTVDQTTVGFNQTVQFAVTWDEATGQIRVYENGAQVAAVVTDDPMSAINDVNCWLGRSNWRGDENMQGEFDEFRIYNRVLSAADVQWNNVAGADNSVGALLNLNLTLATNNLVTNTVAAVRALASFSIAGTQDVAAIGCVLYSSTDSNVVFISSDGLIHAVNEGTATVTASLAGLVDSELIRVTQDATPPTLLSARANSSRHVEVVFSEPVDLGTSEEAGNYVVHGLNTTNEILSVQRLPNQSHVLITLNTPLPPCELITVLVSFVGDQSPLFNQIAERSPIRFLNYIPTGLKHRYTFNNAASADATSAIVPDGVGTADGTVVGAGGTFTGDRVTFPGGASGGTASVVLPAGLLSVNAALNGGSGAITFEGWVKVTGARNWGRIFDFGSTVGTEGRDYFMLSASIGTDVNNRRTELRNEDPAGGGIATVDHATTGFNRLQHFAATWDEATGQIRLYEDGAQRSSIIVNDRMSDINDVNCYLGRSNWSNDENMQGEFDEFRIYDRVLTTNEMTQSIALGPDFNLGTPTCGGGTSAPRLAIQRTGSTFTLSFTGVAGTSYRIQRTTALTTPTITWTTVSTQAAPAGGVITFEDTTPPSPQAFYRVISP